MNVKHFWKPGSSAILLSLALIAITMFGAVPCQAADVSEIADKIQRSFADIKSMTADFSQEVTTRGFGEAGSYRGKLTLLKPGRMRWDFESPAGRQLVVDGKRLWFYEPADKTVYYDNLTGFLHPKSPALFLAEEEPLKNLFDMEIVKSTEGKPDSIKLRLTPKSPQPGLRALLLIVRESDYEIEELVMVDHLGNKNRLIFQNVNRNAKPDAAFFNYEPPAGVPVKLLPKPEAPQG